MELQWTANAHVSVIHTAWCLTHFQQRAAQLSPEWELAASALDGLYTEFKCARSRYWEQLLSLASTADGSGELAQRLTARLGHSSGTLPSRLTSALQQCRSLFQQSFPRFASEIPLRTGPIAQMWEAYGPGLLNMLRRQTGENVVVDQATIMLVQPILGGFGYAHLAANRIHWEALLTHADPRLPEPLRIAWLLSQLDLDRPLYSELINVHRLRTVAGLAMLPAVLAAGQELDLCHYSPEAVLAALQLWQCETLQLDTEATQAVVIAWWETVQSTRPPWRIALTGLDQMLPNSVS